MNNIWFLRTDKDGEFVDEEFDISDTNKFIYSAHGICGYGGKEIIQRNKIKIFPKLLIDDKELRRTVRDVKKELIEAGVIDVTKPGKEQCDLFIWYWIAVMNAGDIAFVRNKKQEIFICRIIGYVSEEFFDAGSTLDHPIFQRPVEILKKVSPDSSQEIEELKEKEIWHRTLGHKTLEKNNKEEVNTSVVNLFKKWHIDLPETYSQKYA